MCRRWRAAIPRLATLFLRRHAAMRDMRLYAGAADALRDYDWLGNVRELARVIERTVALSMTGRITLEDLPPRVSGDYVEPLERSLRWDDTMRAYRGRYARRVLDRCDNDKREGVGFSGSPMLPWKNVCATGVRTPTAPRSANAHRSTNPTDERRRDGSGPSPTSGH